MNRNEIILEYLKNQKESACEFYNNPKPIATYLLGRIRQQEMLIEKEKPKGYTSDDFDAMSNEIARLGEQVKHLQELCQTFIKLDAGGASFLTIPFESGKFSKLWGQISKDLEENKIA
jgi:hypothetical protein